MKNWNTYKAAHVPAKREVEIPPFTEQEQKLLYDVMSIQTTSGHEEPMMLFILEWLKNHPDISCIIDKHNNMYLTKGEGEVYPTYVSHMDQVHNIATSFQIYTAGNKWFAYNKNTMSQVGIGGDDKVGIFICLQALLTFPVCKVVFFTEEEVGCIGSGACNMSFFDNSAFVLQSDRAGDCDFISHTNGVEVHDHVWTDQFQDVLAKYGYSDARGTCTDVGALKNRGLKVACANVSSGYYRAHCDDEYICLPDVMASWLVCKEIGERTGGQVNTHFAPVNAYSSMYGYKGWKDNYSWEDDVAPYSGGHIKKSTATTKAKAKAKAMFKEDIEPNYCRGCGIPCTKAVCSNCVDYYMAAFHLTEDQIISHMS